MPVPTMSTPLLPNKKRKDIAMALAVSRKNKETIANHYNRYVNKLASQKDAENGLIKSPLDELYGKPPAPRPRGSVVKTGPEELEFELISNDDITDMQEHPELVVKAGKAQAARNWIWFF